VTAVFCSISSWCICATQHVPYTHWQCFAISSRQQEHKRARKEAQKEEKQKALEQKRGAIETLLAGMSEEERKEWHQKNKVGLRSNSALIRRSAPAYLMQPRA
jgi:hypothetical protein